MQKTPEAQVPSLHREDPLEEEMATHSSILPGTSHGQRSRVDYKELDMTEYARARTHTHTHTHTHTVSLFLVVNRALMVHGMF